MENLLDNQNIENKKKNITKVICLAIAVLLIISIVSIIILSFNSAENKMNKALSTKNAYEVNSLYEQAFGNDSKLEKYDKTISEFLDDAINSLNNKEYSDDDLAENGYTVVYRDLKTDFGDLIYAEEGYETIELSISYYNQNKWDKLQSIIKSRAAYCSGVAYRESYEQPKEAIDSFKAVTEEDSYYSRVNDEIAKCVDLYVQQTLSEAQKLIDNDDISGAISKINSINTYLENIGITNDVVQQKLEETLESYAKKYYDKAEACFNDKDVDGAIGNIDVAMKLSPNNADYKSKKDTYEMYLPFKLYVSDNCILVDETGDFWGGLSFDVAETSNDNKNMDHSLRWYNNNSDKSVSLNAHYNLKGQYDTVSGVFFLTKDDKDRSFEGRFEIYGDGKLIYTSEKMTGGVFPKQFSVKVTDVQNLTISFYGEGTGGFTSFSSDFGINNLIAQKDFPEDKGE